MTADLPVYAGLFMLALIAATLLPAQSEAALAGLLLTDDYSATALIAAASLGNTLGSVVNWMLGRSIDRFRGSRWFPATPESLERAQRWYSRYGHWSLLLSWAPLIGDLLTLVAGVMREPLPRFLLVVSIAKVARYLVVALVVLHVR